MFENRFVNKHNSPRNEEMYFKNLMFHKQQAGFSITDMMKRMNTCPDIDDRVMDSEEKRKIRLLFTQEKAQRDKQETEECDDYQIEAKPQLQPQMNRKPERQNCKFDDRTAEKEDCQLARRQQEITNNPFTVHSPKFQKKEKNYSESNISAQSIRKRRTKMQENEAPVVPYRALLSPRAKIIQPNQRGYNRISERSGSVEKEQTYISSARIIQSPAPALDRNFCKGSFVQESQGQEGYNLDSKSTPKQARFGGSSSNCVQITKQSNQNIAKVFSPEPCEAAMVKKAPLSAAVQASPGASKYKGDALNKLLASASKRSHIMSPDVIIVNEKVSNKERELEQRKMKQAELPANIKILAPRNANVFSLDGNQKKSNPTGPQAVPPRALHPRKPSISSVARNLYEEKFSSSQSQKENEETPENYQSYKFFGANKNDAETENPQGIAAKHFLMKTYNQAKSLTQARSDYYNFTQQEDASVFQSDESVHHWNSVIKIANKNSSLFSSKDSLKPPCPSVKRKKKEIGKITEAGGNKTEGFSKTAGAIKSNYTQDKIYEYILNS